MSRVVPLAVSSSIGSKLRPIPDVEPMAMYEASQSMRTRVIGAWLLLAIVCAQGCGAGGANRGPEAGSKLKEASEAHVRAFCSACHAYTPPNLLPKSMWPSEIEQMYRLYQESGIKVPAPDIETVAEYFRRRAPEELLVPQVPVAAAGGVQFEQHLIGANDLPIAPAISSVQYGDPCGKGQPGLIVCEMLRGQIYFVLWDREHANFRLLSTEVSHPARVEICDLDRDGLPDMVVANLGAFRPTNDRVGSVVWLRNLGNGTFEGRVLAGDMGRVADVRAADFDGDGDLDLIVAAFGWQTVGDIIYLENRTTDYRQPHFVPRVLDPRHGAIHVPVADVNGDGKLDFVALISQEHETIVAYLGDGQGHFTPQTIFTAAHPAYGSSGIELVDLDGDGDLDVLYTNGDPLDKTLLRPYHGLAWLENRAEFPFLHHRLGDVCGAHRALAADFDGDGRLDICLACLLPEPGYTVLRERHKLPAMLVWEQQTPLRFVPHVLESRYCDYCSAVVCDLDRDGRPDIVAGRFSFLSSADSPLPRSKMVPSAGESWLSVWLNRTPKKAK